MTSPALRRLALDDAEDVLAGFTADPEMERQGEVKDLESAQTYIRFLTNAEEGNHGFAVDVSDRCAGVVGINGATRHKLGWFFYWMHPDFRGQGLTASAAAAVANWALSSRDSGGGGFERLELGHRVNNPTSGAVAQAAGFIHEGTERKKFLVNGERIDVFTYGRLATDPVPETSPLGLKAP
ncbi:GNAT family N-acetyltransferase [Nesterenkonia muleiensis]|uniref:GNAT family N-acetyltransferase n=1 Tax=Nesterenkonia muleiensis TaxID=2282648 RepID=UPI000E73360A|nr:GNAT family protein [Nesterenkonia muleiensis]